MEKEKYWLKFAISGKVEDYLKYRDAKENEYRKDVNGYPFYDRRSGDSQEQYRG